MGLELCLKCLVFFYSFCVFLVLLKQARLNFVLIGLQLSDTVSESTSLGTSIATGPGGSRSAREAASNTAAGSLEREVAQAAKTSDADQRTIDALRAEIQRLKTAPPAFGQWTPRGQGGSVCE